MLADWISEDLTLTFAQEGHADCIANEDGDRQIANAIAYGPEEEVCASCRLTR